jgi:hypothetical protein
MPVITIGATFITMQRLLAMTENSENLTLQDSCPFLCCYRNTTNQIQIARISNIPNWHFERVVFPGQVLLFEALPEAELEIHSGAVVGSILSDKILCSRLQVSC